MLDGGPIQAAEVALAYLALLALRAVEEGHLPPADVDRLFTLLDVRLTDRGRAPELSEAAAGLLIEGHHFHHWGGEWGPDVVAIRAHAGAILGADPSQG